MGEWEGAGVGGWAEMGNWVWVSGKVWVCGLISLLVFPYYLFGCIIFQII